MDRDVPVLALLSQAMVAFTIEVDNAIERRLPHFTMKLGSVNPGFGSPWLISSGIWFAFLRHVGPGMISVRDATSRSGLTPARVSSCTKGLVRWGYVVHHADPGDSRRKPPKSDWVLVPTANGKLWHETFPEVIAEVDASWEARHGADAVAALRNALDAELVTAGTPAPQLLPILETDHRTPVLEPQLVEREPLCLGSLLSRVILSQAYAIEPGLPLALALSANVVRAAGEDGVLVRDLPRASGVAKQEVTTMVNALVRDGHATVEPDPSAKSAKRLRLTGSGADALDAYERAVAQWDPPALRERLEPLAPSAAELHAGGGWRQKVRPPDTLPQYPVVTGHGGYPDGS